MERKEQDLLSLKKEWVQLFDALESANSAFNALLEDGLPVAERQRMKPFIAKWDALKGRAEGFYDALDRSVNAAPEPVDVELPWPGDEFKAEWQYWKDYLREQHHVFVRSRAERKMLARLKKITGGDEAKAVEYLDYAESTLYRMFFKVTEREYEKPSSEERRNDDGDF